jgi:hypothetical protein
MTTISQRFNAALKNNRDYQYRSAQSPITSRKGWKYPTKQQLDMFEKYKIPADVDPILRDIIIELNIKGYRTTGSCQGHGHRGRAFIGIGLSKQEWFKYIPNNSSPPHVILRNLFMKHSNISTISINQNEIINIMKKYGLTNIKYDPPQLTPIKLQYTIDNKKNNVKPEHIVVSKLPTTQHVFTFKTII